MIRILTFFSAVLVFTAAFAEPAEKTSDKTKITVLEIEYRNAKIRGEYLEGIKVLRKILKIIPEDCNWRIKLAEDLLQMRKLAESREEFLKIVSVEPDFHEGRVGVARTYAIEKNHLKAKEYMLEAAKSGYRVAHMMRKIELAEYFTDYNFVMPLIETDKPKVDDLRDPFIVPLRKAKPIDPEKIEENTVKKLSHEEQKQLVENAESNLEKAIESINNRKPDESLLYYREVEKIYSIKDKFSDKNLRKKLEEIFNTAQDTLYPKIESILRKQTLEKAEELLGSLIVSVSRRDKEESQNINTEFMALVKESLKGRDVELKSAIVRLDKKRAQEYRTIEVLIKFDNKVRPILHLRGTITGRGSSGGNHAFFDIDSQNGVQRYVLGESDRVNHIESLIVLRISENAVDLRYEDVVTTLRLGGQAR